jgi:hypothetical protein
MLHKSNNFSNELSSVNDYGFFQLFKQHSFFLEKKIVSSLPSLLKFLAFGITFIAVTYNPSIQWRYSPNRALASSTEVP